ncbi:helix-turn-helix transcriptional regulator [Novosphingobium sp. G106]|uniref:helix-turn-helix transcriptional regulator n=1 Tax=Novosphingobium sp. G106 TaxID=2849500 RepID=UPI001C2CCC90|nr:helix-turn-helix transcriptional regulator [Novosphingobium sp. G106]MBV1689285.1 helix-turn-helix transcriptional regulator [Novosphingobium sp. G106]
MHFTRYRPDNTRPFSEYFNHIIEFDSNFDGFSCSEHLLDVPNPLADERMVQNARALLDTLPANARVRTLAEKTRHAISLMIGSEAPTLTSVARNLGVSARSLQRSLMDEGASFSELLKAARRDLAIRYVNTSSLPLSIVAEMVGFSDGSTFSRWFSREFGEGPLAWRIKRSQFRLH